MPLFLKKSCIPCNLWYWGDSDLWVKMFAFFAFFPPGAQFSWISHGCWTRWVFCVAWTSGPLDHTNVPLKPALCATNQQTHNRPTHLWKAWCTKLSLCQTAYNMRISLSLSSIPMSYMISICKHLSNLCFDAYILSWKSLTFENQKMAFNRTTIRSVNL